MHILVIIMSFVLLSFRITSSLPLRSSSSSIFGRTFSRKCNSQSESVQTLSEKVVYEGYRNMVRRNVIMPTGRNVSFDIVTQKYPSVVVFIWDTNTSTTTLVKEYHPGPDLFMLGTVAGMYEPDKHDSMLDAAKSELEEEAQLETAKWFPLLETQDILVPFDKYSNNHFAPFLALDCKAVATPKAMDDDEYITIEKNIPLPKLMSLIATGKLNVISTYTVLLGLQKLTSLGLLNPLQIPAMHS